MPVKSIKRHLISMADLGKEEIEGFLELASRIESGAIKPYFSDKIIASCFFEPSTRTRLSFEAAAHRIGAHLIGFSDQGSTSTAKGESLSDTVRMLSSYADLLVIRHPSEGAARLAAEVSSVPVINAGDGANQHPTQTLLDLYTIKKTFGKIDGLHIAMMGDLRHGRTVHSLAEALAHYKARLYFVCPPQLELTHSMTHELKGKGMLFSFHSSIEEILDRLDVLYMTRIQKERMPPNCSFDRSGYTLDAAMLAKAKESLKIMHPLPRVDELDPDVDNTRHALYFEQAKNGVAVRKALLTHYLGGFDAN
ncbi:MAG: aspartate carbamoyltransferase [Chlamydiia bacterium]|nr:aspartate carbamoyltransferase [Chlamydiia bacterium]